MGKYKNGILGAFSGRVGSIVGASWKGIDYMRSLPDVSTIPRSDAQNAQTSKMTLFRGFLLGMDKLIKQFFQNITAYTEMNAALSYNMKYAVCGTYPNLVVNFPTVIYSKGDLLTCWSSEASSVKAREVMINWKNRVNSLLSAADDFLTVVLYSTCLNRFHIFKSVAQRSDEFVSVLLPEEESGHSLHCYLNFYSEDLKISSTNEYLGEVTLM